MKMKKLLAMVLCVAMVLSMMAFTVSAESTADVWDGTYSLDWLLLNGGDPEANAGDKFYLNSAEDLAGLAYYVNNYASTNHIFEGDTIYLEVDVDLGNCNWDPIGTAVPGEKNRFYGSFDGKGHTISNLKIADGHYYAGLFGQIPTYNYSQTFSNVTINNAKVVSADEAKSKEAAGALIGRANGTVIKNCHVTGEINISGDRFVGGLLGHSYAQISDCSVEASGTIKANTWQAGGLVGSHGATAEYTSSVNDCSVIGKGDNGLNITSYFASAGGAIGDVSVSSDVDSTTMEGITVANVSIAADSEEFGSGIAYVASGYTATNSTISNVSATLGDKEYVAKDAGSVAAAVALVGNSGYATLKEAIDAAEAGDTITLLAGEYNGFNVPEKLNNVTFVGETDAEGNNLVTIKTLDTGIESHNGGIFVAAENTTFKNLNFAAGTTAGVGSSWMSSSLGNTNGDTGMRSSLKNLTVENCNFTGSGAYQAIWTNQGNVTVKNTTITNYNNGIDNYGIGADQKVVIENSKITDVHNAFHTGEAADGAQIVVTGTDIDSEVINIGGAVAVTVEESTIKNAAVTTYASSTFAVSESALYDTTYAVDANATGSITLDAVYVNNVNELAANAKADNIAFNTYYPEAKDLGTGNTVAVPAATDAIYVKFENVTDADAEGEMTYNINLVATDTEIINRLNSADLTFAFDATEGDVAYEIIASNSEVAVNPVDNSKVRYEFHYNGKDGVTTDSANKITIGQVRFEGYGKFDFTVDAAVDTNTAHATTVADNIVDTFIPNGDAATVANGELVIDDTTITDVVIAVPDRNLTISIDFPNAVENKAIAYQDMKVVISGGDLEKDITIYLGNDAVETALDIFGKEDAKFAAAMDNNGSYVINVTDALTLNNAYTVTVSGAGYRTARYTVTMTTDKTLRFWNNVMDENQVVELGKDSSIAKVTFLAGDIVKDNNINIYDLSAVVSYFGSVSTIENGYAKYDLNRDGVIDSKDVAYVLVSWNN